MIIRILSAMQDCDSEESYLYSEAFLTAAPELCSMSESTYSLATFSGGGVSASRSESFSIPTTCSRPIPIP
jgi:hypothetical protein